MKLYRVQHINGAAFVASEREARAMVKRYRATGDASFKPVDVTPNKPGILAALNRYADHSAVEAPKTCPPHAGDSSDLGILRRVREDILGMPITDRVSEAEWEHALKLIEKTIKGIIDP